MTPRFAGLRERTQSLPRPLSCMPGGDYTAAKAGFGGGIKAIPDAVASPRRCRGFLLTPPKGCLPPPKSSFDADEGRKPGQRRGLPARASTREFSEYIPAVKWNFFAGPLIHVDGKGIAFPRRLSARRRRVNRPLRIALRGQIRVGSSGEASPQGETGASQWSRHNCPRRNHESARPVCATVTPRRRSFRPAIGRTSYLTAASYRSATYSQFTRLSTKALR